MKKYFKKIFHRFFIWVASQLDIHFLSADGLLQKNLSFHLCNEKNETQLNSLVNGLDQDSVFMLKTIIARLQQCYEHDFFYIFHLTSQEKERFEYLKEYFYDQIIKISQDNGKIFWDYMGYRLPKKYFEVGIFIDHHGIKFFKNMENIRKRNIIDVGAFIGDSALILEQYTDQKIYAFEADYQNYLMLKETIALNNLNKTIAINQALGEQDGDGMFYSDGIGSSFVFNKNKKATQVKITTLDSYIFSNHINVGLIKVDIEGFEMSFLKGAIKTLKEQKPSLIISIYHNINDFFGIKKFIEDLNLGYSFKIFKPIDHYVAIDTCLLCEVCHD